MDPRPFKFHTHSVFFIQRLGIRASTLGSRVSCFRAARFSLFGLIPKWDAYPTFYDMNLLLKEITCVANIKSW